MVALIVEGFLLGEVDNALALERYREGHALAKRAGLLGLMLEFANNIGYTAFLVGDWDEGLEVLDGALAQTTHQSSLVWLMSNALIMRVARGEDIQAKIVELDRLVEAFGEPNLDVPTRDTKANAAQAAGRTAEARAHWRAVAEVWSSQAPASYYQAARHGIWSGDLAALREDLAALDATGFHGRVVEVRRTTLRAAEAALDSRTREAHALYKDALAGWRELRVVWEEALTGIDMATVLDPSDSDVRAAATSTREILVRLDAKPYVERLDAALARTAAAPFTPEKPVREPISA